MRTRDDIAHAQQSCTQAFGIPTPCPVCDGTGKDLDRHGVACDRCQGRGYRVEIVRVYHHQPGRIQLRAISWNGILSRAKAMTFGAAVLIHALFAMPAQAGLDAERMADCIYQAEGRAKTRHPYGVLSVRTANHAEARQVCIRSIKNNWTRWQKAGRPGDFVAFMAARWVPASVDPVGHRNWIANMRRLMAAKH